MWGSLDGSMPESWPTPEAEAWKDREAQAALAAINAAKPRTWADTWQDAKGVAQFPVRMLTQMHEEGKKTAIPGSWHPMSMDIPQANVLRGLGSAVGEAVSSGFRAPGDALAGKLPMWDSDGNTSPEAVRRVFDTASLAGGGAVGGAAGSVRAAAPALAADAAKSGAPVAAASHVPAPLYSALDEAFAGSKMTRAPGAQWESTLRNTPGVKMEELEYRGVGDFLRERAGQPIARDELSAFLQANPAPKIETKDLRSPEWADLGQKQYDVEDTWKGMGGRHSRYESPEDYYNAIRNDPDEMRGLGLVGSTYEQYTLPRGYNDPSPNYRERLLRLEGVEPQFAIFAGDRQVSPQTFASSAEAREWAKANRDVAGYGVTVRQANEVPQAYVGPHWGDEAGVVAHRRSTDREFPQPLTPEETAAIEARTAAEGQLNGIRQQQNMMAREIRNEVKPIEAARNDKAYQDFKAGTITRAQYNDIIEQPVSSPQLTALQERLQALRAEEDAVRAGMPAEPQSRNIRSLHAEEIQSDWHQAGRKEGYGESLKKNFRFVKAEDGKIHTMQDGVQFPIGIAANEEAAMAAARKAGIVNSGVPDGPFKKTWHELAAKDMLREAVEGDYPRISWTAGGSQPTNPKNLGGGGVSDDAVRADAGLRGFYDKILPDYLNKLGKKYGAKVERGSLPDKSGMSGEKAMDRMGIPKEEQAAFWDDLVNNQPHGAREEFLQKARDMGHEVFYMDIPQAMRDDIRSKGFSLFEDTGPAAQAVATAAQIGGDNVGAGAKAGLDVGRGLEGGVGRARSVEEAQAAAARHAGAYQPLEGLPTKPLPVGGEPFIPGPIGSIHDVAKSYMESTGRPYVRQDKFHPVDVPRAKLIAQAFDRMKHEPDNPRVKASYAAMIKETADQYDAAVKSGVKFEPIPPGMPDPYAETPRAAAKDVQENNHLWYFPTESGYGKDIGDPNAVKAISDNPMLQKTGRKDVNGNEMLANDLFRVVHDYFGHLKEGHGFRAAGEDNAWRTHANMYSDEARPAMTTETRGQNSWVNYGPHGDKNRTASSADTVYADQKVGLLPDWVMGDMAPKAHARPGIIDESGGAIAGRAYTKEAQKNLKAIAARPKGEGPLDLSTQSQVPHVAQQPLDRYVPPRGISARMKDALENPDVMGGLKESMEKGRGVENWYHTEPVRKAFIDELGEAEGAAAFKQYMDYVAATSPRSDVPTNIRNASYYYAGGDPKAKKNPYPYGHVAQKLHKSNIQTVDAGGGWDVMRNPKPASFAENLRGNLEPVTVDTHAFRNIAMRTGDPRFLETTFTQKRSANASPGELSLIQRYGEYNPKTGIVTFRPAKLYKEGRLTMEDAMKIPSFWAGKPKPNEYGVAERMFKQAGDDLGMRPADAQAAAWSGGGEMTGLGTVGTHTFNELFNERVMFTALMRGISPEQVLKDFIRKKKPLLSDTSGGLAFGSLDGRQPEEQR